MSDNRDVAAQAEAYAERAKALFLEGLNCAQAVFVALCPLTGLDARTAAALASSFGGGLGRMREVCGALSGAALAAGALFGDYDPADRDAKREHYARIQRIAARFREDNGDIICRSILGLKSKGADDPAPLARTPEYYASRSCADCVYSATLALLREFSEK